MHGAVLAVNVKDIDLLTMDKATISTNTQVNKEWESLGEKPHGIDEFHNILSSKYIN